MSAAKRLSSRDFATLLTFLGDDSEKTASLARAQIRDALRLHPAFRDVVRSVRDPDVKKQAELLIEGLWFEELEPRFRTLLKTGPGLDLEQAAYLLATVDQPALPPDALSGRLDDMASEVERMIVAAPALPTRPIHALRRYLFDLQGYRGLEGAAQTPETVFLPRVLDTRVGNPIALSCLYLFLGWRLGLLVHGIGLPGHFMVGHRIPRGVVHIDPSQRGRVLRKKDCEVLVRRLGTRFKEEHLDPVSNRQILARMTANLINIYSEQGSHARAYWLARLYRLFEE